MDSITLSLLLDVSAVNSLFLFCLDSLNFSPTVLGWRDPPVAWTGAVSADPPLVLGAAAGALQVCLVRLEGFLCWWSES